MLSLRIFTINYYLINPEAELDETFSEFRRCEVKQVPIIRVFGSTTDGEKACLHVHNVFPYLLIRNFRTDDQLERFLYDLTQNIDKTLNITIGQKDTANIQHVYKIEILAAKSMYGYHENDSSFLKIYLYNPDLIKRLSELLVNGIIMNETFQPYNSHIPYNLQFLIDYNLFGMNIIHLKKAKFRKVNKDLFFEQDESFEPKWRQKLDVTYLDEIVFPRQSLCEIEFDCKAADITNPNLQKDDVMLNPGLSALWSDERKRRKTLNIDGTITPPESQERENILTAETETSLKTRLIELLEERLNSKYPFNKADKSVLDASTISRMLSHSQLDEICDENIIDILDSLHNETTICEINEDEDEDSALIYEAPLNDEEKLELIEENNEMTQKVGIISLKIDEEFDNENHEILNNSNSSSSDNDDEEDIVKGFEDEEEEDDEGGLAQQMKVESQRSSLDSHQSFKRNATVSFKDEKSSTSINWADFEMDSQLDSILKRSKPKRKYKGAKRMVVKLERLDLSKYGGKSIVNAKSHYCQYFKTKGTSSDKCTHRKDNHISQAICLNCDYKTEQQDSLIHMAFESPVKNPLVNIEKPIFSSPTLLNEEEDTTTLENEDESNKSDDTLAADDFCEFEESTDSNQSSINSISSDESFSEEDFSEKSERKQLKRKKIFEKLKPKAIFPDNQEKKETMENNDNGIWICPVENVPTILNSKMKTSASDSIICYSAENSKKWKLNVEEFDSIYKAKHSFEKTEKDSEKEFWFTPAIPFPSFDKSVKNKGETKRKKLKKIISEANQLEKCSIISSNGSVTSTLTRIESDFSQLIGTSVHTGSTDDTDIIPPTAMPIVKKSEIDLSQSLMKSKKKLVRFNENQNVHDELSNDSNFSSVSQPVHEKSTIDYSEVSICDETLTANDFETSKMSFYEYNSIFVPKCTKFIDSLICTQDLTTTIIEPKLPHKEDFKHNIEPTNLSTTESNFLSLMSMELYINARDNLTPNSDFDSIGFICYAISSESKKPIESNFILFDSNRRSLATTRFICSFSKQHLKSIDYAYSEEDLIKKFIKIVQIHDPDILVGFEIQKTSWCYFVKRAIKLGINDICKLLSRLPKSNRDSVLRIAGKTKKSAADELVLPQDLQIGGRVVLNLWRILRSELSLNIYTFENCCYHILHERTPKYSNTLLTSFFQHRTDLLRWKVFSYYSNRTQSNLKMLDKLNLISKTCEFSRVYGIEFYHVLSRGSQYRVESMMIRIAKKLNFIPVSPSQQQKSKMRAPECIPLTLEPESKFYTDPVAILDFQSLYPSVIIAFNICFTTCLGRVESIGKDGCFKFGCTSLFIPDDLIKSLDFDKDIYFAPSGVAFVKSHIRKGILPIMLEDILKTRVMVKSSMKLYKNDNNLLDLLDARQLSLKLIANVTFGYTAANFSGRMPCTEVGDTIVRQARTILENSIKFIHSNFHKYGGRVVYGDTDSMFIVFEKINKTKAFEISHKIVNDISNMYKKPVKLKFEKIYHPCVLISKKRYVGYSYETITQLEPVLDAKGIEVVRRDGCQVGSKILERCLKILFEFKEPEKVKNFIQRQCAKIVQGKVNLKEFIIAKEYRGRDTYSNVKSVAACQIANRNLTKDPLAEPLTGERVPYLIALGPPGLPLYELVRAPDDFLMNQDLRVNYEYYIMKQILPPLDRIMGLMNINVFEWVNQISFKPKVFHKFVGNNLNTRNNAPSISIGGGLTTLTKFLVTTDCMLCGKKCDKDDGIKQSLCEKCSKMDPQMIIKLKIKFKKYEKQYSQLLKVCKGCTLNIEYGDFNRKLDCNSLDCPNLYSCYTTQEHLDKHDYLREIIDEYF